MTGTATVAGGPDAAADGSAAHAPRTALIEILRDPEVQRAKQLEYDKKVREAYARYTAEQLKPHEAKPEHAPSETTDKPASAITRRVVPERKEEVRQAKPERSWLPSNETTQFAASIGALASVVADVVNFMPAKLDAVAASALAVVVTGVAWGNKRWKDRNGDRSEG